MKKRLFVFFGLALCAIALSITINLGLSRAASAAAKAQDHAAPTGSGILDSLRETFVVDVACDGTTFRLNKSGTILDARRGDGFIVQGKIYRGGTIQPGGTMENPGPFDPRTAPGAIGDWVCRGSFAFDIGEILMGPNHISSARSIIFSKTAEAWSMTARKAAGRNSARSSAERAHTPVTLAK